MTKQAVKEMDVAAINAELEFAGIERRFKRIDGARNFLLKFRKEQEKKPKVAKKRKSQKEKVEYKFKPSKYDGHRVFTSRGAGIVKGYDESAKYWLVRYADGKEKPASERAVRFKAVDDSYREQYVHDTGTRTESGAVTIHCGDDLAEKLAGLTHLELSAIAKENDLKARWEVWSGKVTVGMCRMNLGNVLRARLRRNELVTIFGKKFSMKGGE